MGSHRLGVAGLFAGVGGIESGLARSGHETRLLCEIDDAACAVLSHHFPRVRLHRDVRSLGRLPADTDLLTAGFPCQDLSQAGRVAGIEGPSSGLWREIFSLSGHPKTGHRWTAENRPTESEPAGTVFAYSIAPTEGKTLRWGRLAADVRWDPYRGMGRVEIVAPGASLEAEFGAESTFRYLT